MKHSNRANILGFVPSLRLYTDLFVRNVSLDDTKPFNIASYALLTMMIAQVAGLKPGDFGWTGGDCHLYTNHLDQTREQLSRSPRPLPTMTLNPDVTDLFAFRFEDFTLSGYAPHPHIKAPVAV